MMDVLTRDPCFCRTGRLDGMTMGNDDEHDDAKIIKISFNQNLFVRVAYE